MEIDPATICARTGAGEAELAQARSGLTLPQRKALSLLAAPRVYAEFAAENNLDPERLGRDFSRLAELGLITLQLGSVVVIPPVRPRVDPAPVHAAPAPRPKVKPAPIPADARLRPVVIGAAPGRSPLRVALLTGVVVAAVGAGWFALRDDPRAGARPEAVASPTPLTRPAASTVPIIAATPGSAPPETTAPASAPPRVAAAPAVQPPRVAPPERPALSRGTASTANSASARASDVKVAVAAAVPAHASASGSPVVERTPGKAGQAPERVTETAVSPPPVPPPPAVAAPVPSPAAPALQVASAAPVSSPAAPPLQVASAAKASVAASPSAKTALQPIVREAPEFPREAIAEGVASGTVKARVTLDGSGKVTGIEILDAQPRRVFDRAVRAALWRWQYEPGAPNRTADVEVAFARQ